MKFDKTHMKYIVSIYSAAMCIMGMLVPVPIIAQIAQAFPEANIAAVQMCIGIIPLCMALSAICISTFFATRVLKRYSVLVCRQRIESRNRYTEFLLEHLEQRRIETRFLAAHVESVSLSGRFARYFNRYENKRSISENIIVFLNPAQKPKRHVKRARSVLLHRCLCGSVKLSKHFFGCAVCKQRVQTAVAAFHPDEICSRAI